MKEKRANRIKEKILLKQNPTPPNKERHTPTFPGFASPLTGLALEAGGTCFPGENVLWLTILGAHLGRFPVKSAQFAPSPLMCSSLSGKRGAFSIINQQNIAIQLVRAFYIIALLLKNGGRVLLISESDEKTLPRQIILEGGKNTPDHEEFQQVVSGERLIISQGLWKAGTCSNWLQICKKVWNWSHCQQFFALSGGKSGGEREKTLERRKQYFQQATPFPRIGRDRWSSAQESRHPDRQRFFSKKNNVTPALLYYSKKPDLICVLTSGKTSSLIGEAQALKVPLLYLADTDFNLIHCNSTPSVKAASLINQSFRQPYMYTNGAYPWIANGDCFSFPFFLSSLLAQLVCCNKKREKG